MDLHRKAEVEWPVERAPARLRTMKSHCVWRRHVKVLLVRGWREPSGPGHRVGPDLPPLRLRTPADQLFHHVHLEAGRSGPLCVHSPGDCSRFPLLVVCLVSSASPAPSAQGLLLSPEPMMASSLLTRPTFHCRALESVLVGVGAQLPDICDPCGRS